MQIDFMKEEDLEAVQVLSAQLGYPVSLSQIAERFNKISRDENYRLLVARSKSGQPLGWVQINLESMSLLASQNAEIAALVVDEKERGQGIGKALVKAAESWAKDNHLELIRLRSNLKRTDAHRFYLREGFELLKTSCIFTKKP